jgi:GSH-dependent disulfide-bond oxidoreductase
MSNTTPYTPPAIWQWNKENGGQLATIKRPIADAMHDKELQAGEVGAGLNGVPYTDF